MAMTKRRLGCGAGWESFCAAAQNMTMPNEQRMMANARCMFGFLSLDHKYSMLDLRLTRSSSNGPPLLSFAFTLPYSYTLDYAKIIKLSRRPLTKLKPPGRTSCCALRLPTRSRWR